MKTRIISAIIALVLFIPFLLLGENYFLFAMVVLGGYAIYEVINICLKGVNNSILLLAVFLSLTIFFVDFIDRNIHILSVLVIVFLLFLEIILSSNKLKLGDVSTVLFLTIYISAGFYSLYLLRNLDILVVLYLMLTIWVTDSFAYFGGMKYGRRKLSPSISPNKSIEGAIIGSLSTVIVAVAFYIFTDIFSNIFITVVLTLLISCVGQIGDLVESAFKREYNVKDSSNLIPGHGGVFDRFDSMILAAPFLVVLFEFIK